MTAPGSAAGITPLRSAGPDAPSTVMDALHSCATVGPLRAPGGGAAWWRPIRGPDAGGIDAVNAR